MRWLFALLCLAPSCVLLSGALFERECGDGILDLDQEEECDDGNNIDADGCEADCTLPACGNGIYDPGEFCFQQSQPLLSNVEDVVAADFNLDGALDFATTARFDPEVIVLINDGLGFFQAQSSPSGFGTCSMIVVDFNKDGIPDILSTNADGATQSGFILLGDGDGFFVQAQNFPARCASAMAAGDLNKDGELDLVTAFEDFEDGLEILLGNGDGSFQSQSLSIEEEVFALGLEDFNNDNVLDLAFNASIERVGLLFGNGDGSFQPMQTIQAGLGPKVLSTHDINNDGIPDLTTSNLATDNVSILFGNGDGSFAPQQVIADIDGPILVDADKDGAFDLVGNSVLGTIVRFGQSGGTFSAPQLLLLARVAPSFGGAFFAEDLNQDGVLDLVVASPVSLSLSVRFSQP